MVADLEDNGKEIYLRTVHFEDIYLINLIFIFDSATLGRASKLEISEWPYIRFVKEVLQD